MLRVKIKILEDNPNYKKNSQTVAPKLEKELIGTVQNFGLIHFNCTGINGAYVLIDESKKLMAVPLEEIEVIN